MRRHLVVLLMSTVGLPDGMGGGGGRSTSSRRQAGVPTGPMARPTLVFDGECRFCSVSARFIARWIPTDARVVASQLSDLEALGVTRRQAERSVQWVDPTGRHTEGPHAIADLLTSSRARVWRAAGRVLGRRQVLRLAEPVYDWVSRHRRQVPTGRAVVDLPPAQRRRFSLRD